MKRMIMNKSQRVPFGPEVIIHDENPKQKFLDKIIKKEKPDQHYSPTVTERKIEHTLCMQPT